MSGLDKIIHQILEEANDLAKKRMQAASEEAKKVAEMAEEEAKKMQDEILKYSEIEVKNYEERVKSAADLNRRTAVLEAKQRIIAEVLQKSYERFCAVEGSEYFEILKDMLNKFAVPKKGEIYFSLKDLARMPQGFKKEVASIAQDKGGSLIIADEAKEIDGGFILVYGGIEENCSFKALFEAKRAELQDQVQKILFT